ncbi:putative dithiol-disulfide oxidoreductase (DUF899 family) [Asanoa ferruginea]|uniref:Putative dithiol-disulfide oxidoreductase (DUF899 family) n=1 Tax=Asanoa ferruginea TaxID=53367 RepID=A0A3D9ZSN2_9ACTN|nr:DUF899 family protein [Asanoa ferruginea]REF99003.1 putative dithiol-disulfide oxidoreductase (DUF899 family) [Asanoa ferruginea]GIF46314.1 hypothetical protein Afe04nite_08530 [Asanoa ferruginea]
MTPQVVDRATWLQERAALLVREKAHTRAGDAIAAARRRLPMVEVDPTVELIGANGPTPLHDIFEGRDQLLVCKHMWHRGQGFAGQCRGCTATVWNFQDATYLEGRGVTFAVWCQGPYAEFAPYREFMGYRVPWYSVDGIDVPGISDGWITTYLRVGDRIFQTYETDGRGCEVMMPALQLLDLTVYGRQEEWEDSPEGWPQDETQSWFVRDGRPIPQWTRLMSGSAEVGADCG